MSKGQHAPYYQTLKTLLVRMREDANLTQRDLAKRLHQSQPWVHKSEVGERRVDIAEFLEWCIACDINPEDAFRRLIRARR